MKIIIIGGTSAGTSAAAKANRLNKKLDITIYEKQILYLLEPVACLTLWGDSLTTPIQ